MAARDKLDRSAGRDFAQQLSGAGFDVKGAVENVGAGYHTLAEAFSGWRDSPYPPRQHAEDGRRSPRHRRRLCAVFEIQGVLGFDPRGQERWARVKPGRADGPTRSCR